MADKIINDFTVLFKTVLDEKSKREVGKNIRGLLNNAVISFDESEIKRNIAPIVNMIQQVFDKAGIKFDGEKLLGMSGKDALQSMANMKAGEFQNAFNKALAKSGGVKIDFGDVDISGISTSLNQLESELSDIHRKVVDAPKKSVSEIEDSIRKLKSSEKAVQQIEGTLNSVNKQSNIQSEDKAVKSLTKAHQAIVKSQEKNDPWQIQYQNMLKFVSKYEAMAGKIKPLVDTSNPEFKQLYDMLSPKSSSMKISLQHFVDVANGNELTEYKHQPWAREETLKNIGRILSGGISVKGNGVGDGDGNSNTNLSNDGDDGNNVNASKIEELQNHIRSNEEEIENLRKQLASKQKSYRAFKGIDAESAVGSRREIYDEYGADYYSTDASTAAQYATGPGSHAVVAEITPKTPLMFNATDFVESGDYSKLYENPEFISAFKDALIQQIKKTTASGKEQDKKISEIQNAELYTTDGTKVNLDNAENNQIALNNLAKKAGFDSVIIDKVLDYPSNVLDNMVGDKERRAVKTKLSKTIAVLSDDILNVVGFREAIETDRGPSLSTKVTKKVPDYYQMPTYTTEKGTKKKKAVTELSDDYKERVDINNKIKELKNENQNLQTELDAIKTSTQKDVSETSSNTSGDTKNQTSTAKDDSAVHNANTNSIKNEAQAQENLNKTETQNPSAKDDTNIHNANAEAVKNEIQAQEKLKNIQQQPDNIDNDAEIIAQENGALENKLELLRNIAKQYGMDISQRDRNRYESLNQKDTNDDLTSKEKEKFAELRHKIDEADQNLMKFEETYDRIVLKLANGKKINILPDDKGLRSLYNFANGFENEYNGVAVDGLEFVRKEAEAHQKNTAAINTEVQAQSTLNQVETQNPPTQDESSIHNANADAINNETRAREKLNDAESKNPPRVKTNSENIQTILGDMNNFLSSKKGATARDYFTSITTGAYQMSNDVKSAIEATIGSITTLNTIDIGSNNYGGLIGDKSALILRKPLFKKDTRTWDTDEKYGKAKELQDRLSNVNISDVNLGTIQELVKAEGYLVDLQNRVSGAPISTIGEAIETINPEILNVTEASVRSLIQAMHDLYKAGIEVDTENLGNILYDGQNDKFGLVDMDVRKDGAKSSFASFDEEVGAFAQTVRNQIEDITDPNMAKAWSRFADMVDAENNTMQQQKKLNTAENQNLPARDESNTHNANAESIKNEERAQNKLNETEAQNPPVKDDSNVHNANANAINNETQAQKELNQSESQNPPTQDESSIHNINAEAINNKVQAQANLNKTEAQNPPTKDDTNIHNANAEAINNEVQVQAKLNQVEAQNPPAKDVSNVHNANAKSISNEIQTQERLAEKNKVENILLQKQKEIFDQILVLQSKEDLLTAKKGQKAGYYQQKIDDILQLIQLQELYQRLCGQPIEGNFKYSVQQLDDAVVALAGARMAAEDVERLHKQLAVKKTINDVKSNEPKPIDNTPQIQGENSALDEQNTKLKENIALKEKTATVNKSSSKETSVAKESSASKAKSTKTEAQDETLKKEKISDAKNQALTVKDNSDIHNTNANAIKNETQAQEKLNQAENHNPKMESEIKEEAMSYDELKQKVETYIKARQQMFSLMEHKRPWQHMLPNVEAAQANITNLFPEKGDKPTNLTASMVGNMLGNQTINEDHIRQLAIALGIEIPQVAQKAEDAINGVVAAQEKLNNAGVNNNVEVQNNENKIKSYEELCEVITRLNILRAKQLTPKEHSEQDEILTKLKATKGKSAPNKQISDFMQWSSILKGSGPVNVDQMANFLGIQIPEMNKNIKSDKNVKKKTDTDVQQIELENKAIDEQNVKLKENINLKQQTEQKTVVSTNISQSTVLPTQTVPNGTISTEVTELEAVKQKVGEVTEAINTKTQAFLTEQSTVKRVAQSEVHALGEVEKKVNAVKVALSNVSQVLSNVKSGVSVESGLSNININVNRNDDKNAGKNNIDESVIQRLLKNVYTVKSEAVDNTETNKITIDEAALGAILNNITYKVHIVNNDAQTKESKVSIDGNTLEGILRRVFANKLTTNKTNKKPSVKTNKTDAVNTLKSTDNLQDSSNVGNVLATEDTLSTIKTAVERINSKIVKGTTSRSNNGESKRTYRKKDNAESYAGSQFFPEKIKTQSMYLAKFRAQLMTTGKLTDDVDLQIYELLNGLSKIQNGPDLSKWNQQFLQLKTKVGIGDIFGKAEDKVSTASYEQLIEFQKTRNKLELQYTKAEDGSPLKQFYAEQIAQMDGVIAKQEELILNEQQRAELAKLGTEQSFKIQEDAAKKETQNNKKALAADKKLKKRQAMVGKANSIVSRAESTWLEAGELDHLQLPDTFQTQVMQHREELDKLILKLHEVNIAQELTDDDVNAIRQQTAEVNKQTEALSRLVAEYQKLSGDNVDESLSRATNLNFDDKNLSITDYEKQMKAYVADVTNGQGKIKEFNAETKTLTYTMKTGRNEYTEYTAAVRNLDHQLVSVRGSTKKAETFFQATARKMKELSSYFTGMTLFYRLTSVVRQGIGYIKEIDAALTELKKVTDETEETYEKFLDTASKTADKVGSTIKDVVSSTADWARLNI